MTDKHYYENRRNKPRLPIVYTTPDILQKLEYLAEKYGSKKAAIEAAIVMLFDSDVLPQVFECIIKIKDDVKK